MKESSEYVQINIKLIVVGVIAGVIASLWAIVPFFITGVNNLWYVTASLGLIFLFMFVGFSNKKTLLNSGALAAGVFLLLSFLVIPFASGLFIGGTIDTSQYDNSEYKTMELALPGLFCQGCAYSSQSALKGIPGVIDASVDYDSKSGIVIYDPEQVNPESILSNDLIQAYGGEIVNG